MLKFKFKKELPKKVLEELEYEELNSEKAVLLAHKFTYYTNNLFLIGSIICGIFLVSFVIQKASEAEERNAEAKLETVPIYFDVKSAKFTYNLEEKYLSIVLDAQREKSVKENLTNAETSKKGIYKLTYNLYSRKDLLYSSSPYLIFNKVKETDKHKNTLRIKVQPSNRVKDFTEAVSETEVIYSITDKEFKKLEKQFEKDIPFSSGNLQNSLSNLNLLSENEDSSNEVE